MRFMTKDPLGFSKSQLVLVGLLIIASFFIGKLYTQVQFLQGGKSAGSGAPAAAAKYASFDEAMGDVAKKAGIDGKKLVACMNSGEKKAKVDSELSEGTTLGVSGTPAFFINGRLLGGAFPFESFKEIIDMEFKGTGSDDVTAYSKDLQDAAAQGAFDPKPKNVTVGDSHFRGKGGSSVVIVEYSDFQCPYCARALPTVKQVLDEYGDKVMFSYKHFPLESIHPRAHIAAQAAECAGDQGKFWEFHDALFETQQDWTSL